MPSHQLPIQNVTFPSQASPAHTCACGKTFSYKKTLKRHINRTKPTHQFTCQRCPRRCDTNNQLKLHQFTHQETAVKKYVCERCGNHFAYPQSLSRHIAQIHTASNEFICDACGMGFGTQCLLNHHKISMHSVNKHACTQCNKTYKHKYHLTHHIQKIHEGIGLKECNTCHKTFKKQNDLTRHIEAMHLKQELKCSCGKVFNCQLYLTRHKKICKKLSSKV